MKWGKTLVIKDIFSINERLLTLIKYITSHYNSSEYWVSDIEATGKLGNTLTEKLDSKKEKITKDDLETLLKEDGQIFEINLFIIARCNFFISVQRGSDVDVLGDGETLPAPIIGESIDLGADIVESYDDLIKKS